MILDPQQRDALYPEGFGLVVQAAEKVHTPDMLRRTLLRHADALRQHGAVLLRRQDIGRDLPAAIEESREYTTASTQFAAQLIHAHPKAVLLAAPVPNPVSTVFCSRRIQRQQLHAFLGTPAAAVATIAHPSVRKLQLRKSAQQHAAHAGGVPEDALDTNGVWGLTDEELDAIQSKIYWEGRTASHAPLDVMRAVQASQRAVSDDLVEIDWREFAACIFRDGLPHARDLRQKLHRCVKLWLWDEEAEG